MKKEFIEITCVAGMSDANLFTEIVNQGIDAHLEAFTKSKFDYKKEKFTTRLAMQFHITELPLLVRRLREVGDESADNWAEDIENLEEYPQACN